MDAASRIPTNSQNYNLCSHDGTQKYNVYHAPEYIEQQDRDSRGGLAVTVAEVVVQWRDISRVTDRRVASEPSVRGGGHHVVSRLSSHLHM